MASSTPPPHCTLTTTKPYQNHNFHHLQNHHQQRNPHNQNWASQKVSLDNNNPSHSRNAAPKPPTFPGSTTGRGSSFPSLSAADFSGRRSTRFVSKMHFGRPKSTASCRHTSAAEDVLQRAIRCIGDHNCIDDILLSFEPKLRGSDDYTFLLRELGNRGEWSMAMRCFEFSINREKRPNEQGKLVSSMISTLGRLGKVDLAREVFEKSMNEGYGNTVYAYSALISAYAKSGYCDEAIGVFQTMKDSGLKPNLVTFNALINACGKGGADFKRASMIFDEMLSNGVKPDRITYNSLLAVCSGAGLWETARKLFSEMVYRGIDQDIYTYNTLLDAACNGGHIDVAFEVMSEMSTKNILPNEVTYSTIIRGCAKAGRLDRALSLFNEMKFAGIKLDRVSYNTLLAIYASLGRCEEALNIGKEMENMGIKKDVVTYNALLDGFGKQGMYDRVKELFAEMKVEKLMPNLLTYSTLISVYSKGGLYQDAMEVYREFKQRGMKADVVFYSKLIDALCKMGLVESSAMLLDEMTREGIQPNVVTYNSIINAFGLSVAVEYLETQMGYSSLPFLEDVARNKVEDEKDDKIIEIFKQLAHGKSCSEKWDMRGKQDFLCVLGVFQKMHEKEIKPNVVTFSAILNACSRCSSFEEASLLLEELRLFDNHIYGVAHGLLMGHNENVWLQALSLFDEVKQMDSSTASAFYNALTDMLWHFGKKRGAQLVVLEGKRRQVWENTWSESCLDLHLMSSGAARAMVHAWLLNIRSIVFEGHELPKLVSILTGWGKHSKVMGDGALKRAIEAQLTSIGAPFEIAKCNIGRFICAVAVSSFMRHLSGRSDGGQDVHDEDKTHDIDTDGNRIENSLPETEAQKVSKKSAESSRWNPLSRIGISRDTWGENKPEQDHSIEDLIKPIAMKGRIMLYTRLGCQDCKETRRFLHGKRLRYVEINIDVYPTRKLELEKIAGSYTVPKVFFNEVFIGGLAELKSLEESGKLGEKIEYVVTETPSFEAPLPPLSGEDDLSSSGAIDELALIVRKMKGTVSVKDRFYKMRRFTNCFLGSEAVDFLSEDQYLEREEAVEFGRKLASKLFFQHVLDENVFEDGNHLYRFLDDDPIVSQCQNIPRGIIEVKPKPIVEISSRLRFLSYAILEAYVSEDGKHVDYRSIHGSEEFARYLRITEELQRVELCEMPREENLAFFINLYNMMAIHAILVWGQPSGALERRKLLGDFKYLIGGLTYSLSAIYNGILRGNQRPPYNLIKPFGVKDKRLKVALPCPEPLVHFALVCGTRSCPALRCYSPQKVDEELIDAARNFLRTGGLYLDVIAKVAYVSKILKWYSVDFGKNEFEVLRHAASYLEPVESQALLELLSDNQLKVIYQPYDWGLNH